VITTVRGVVLTLAADEKQRVLPRVTMTMESDVGLNICTIGAKCQVSAYCVASEDKV
jgi:hypothetical protein